MLSNLSPFGGPAEPEPNITNEEEDPLEFCIRDSFFIRISSRVRVTFTCIVAPSKFIWVARPMQAMIPERLQ